ncbi:hypothetical protein DIPPA_00470 [Diplonema papillatum]|nr:hypothetical protein DIPPA_00470 [Diplonema papillatum]
MAEHVGRPALQKSAQGAGERNCYGCLDEAIAENGRRLLIPETFVTRAVKQTLESLGEEVGWHQPARIHGRCIAVATDDGRRATDVWRNKTAPPEL